MKKLALLNLGLLLLLPPFLTKAKDSVGDTTTQKGFERYVQSLEVDKLSQFIEGIEKHAFFNIEVESLFSTAKVEHDTWFTEQEELAYLVSTTSASYKMFSVTYRIFTNNDHRHRFLDLSIDSLIEIMNQKGITKHQLNKELAEWQWKYSNIDCKLSFHKSNQNREKAIQYTCQSKN